MEKLIQTFFLEQINISTWNCNDNFSCIENLDGTGEFSSLEDCESTCTYSPTWNCNDNFSCIENLDGTGEFSSLEDCESTCTYSPTWNCNDNFSCIENLDGTGEFSSLKNVNPFVLIVRHGIVMIIFPVLKI